MTLVFQQHDDPEHGECPPGFDHVAARHRATAFVEALRRRIGGGQVGELDTRIEDASFHSEVSFPGGYGHLRFSCFGEMVALTPDCELLPAIVEAIQEMAPAHGYVFVPTELLETPYTGGHPGVTGIATWWIRFFDYL